MCFHTAITSKSQQIELRFGAKFYNTKIKASFDQPHYHLNGFEHPSLPIITQEVENIILPATWGIVPPSENPKQLDSYYKKASRFGGGLNVRSEKLTTHLLYKKTYRTQRCLILVNAFFEPHHFKSKSYPYLIRRKDFELFALAGIYTRFENSLITCGILTREAMPYLAQIHNQKKRQPVILPRNIEQVWLDNTLNEEDILNCINFNYNEEDLESYPVSKKLQKPSEDSDIPEILEPYNYPELNRLF